LRSDAPLAAREPDANRTSWIRCRDTHAESGRRALALTGGGITGAYDDRGSGDPRCCSCPGGAPAGTRSTTSPHGWRIAVAGWRCTSEGMAARRPPAATSARRSSSKTLSRSSTPAARRPSFPGDGARGMGGHRAPSPAGRADPEDRPGRLDRHRGSAALPGRAPGHDRSGTGLRGPRPALRHVDQRRRPRRCAALRRRRDGRLPGGDVGARSAGDRRGVRAPRQLHAGPRRAHAPVPVLHAYAQPDDPGYLEAQRAFAAEHSWFSVHKLDARSHFPTIEAPDQLAVVIGEFV
jgi:hypothetical protein